MKRVIPNPKFDVKSLRRRLGLTQEEFCARIGCHLRTVRNWERYGHVPNGTALRALRALEAEQFGGPVTSVLGATPLHPQRKKIEDEGFDPASISILPSSF